MVSTLSQHSAGTIETSLGTFHARFGPSGLERLLLPGEDPRRAAAGAAPGAGTALDGVPDHRVELLAGELKAYAAGTLRQFRTPVSLRGTEFQLRVWGALATVGYGRLTTYREVALRVGGSARAVGAANSVNPVPILIPCHRVIGSDGSLTGYAGGIHLKRRLLELEGADPVFR